MTEQITAEAAFEAEVKKQLNEWENQTIFDKKLLPDNFGDLVKEVLSFNSPFHLRMSIDYYKQLVTNTSGEYTLMEISCIGHAAKIRTAHEMKMTIDEYVDFQGGIESIAQEYLKLVAEKRKSIEQELSGKKRGEVIDFPIPTAQA